MSNPILSDHAPWCVLNLEARNERAEKIIGSYAMKHAAMDVAIGLAGFIPIPGAATVALLGAIVAQAPVIYTPVTKELADLYSSSPDSSTGHMLNETVMMGALRMLALNS